MLSESVTAVCIFKGSSLNDPPSPPSLALRSRPSKCVFRHYQHLLFDPLDDNNPFFGLYFQNPNGSRAEWRDAEGGEEIMNFESLREKSPALLSLVIKFLTSWSF